MTQVYSTTLTTCIFDTSKFNIHAKSVDEAIKSMMPLLQCPCYLVIYTDETFASNISQVRNNLNYQHLTKIVIMNMMDLPMMSYLQTVIENRKVYHPTRDARTSPESHLITASKFDLVLRTIADNPFNTEKFGWIDSFVNENWRKIGTNCTQTNLLNILCATKPEKFYIQVLNVCDNKFNSLDVDILKQYYSCYRYIVCGCLFICGKDIGNKILTELKDIAVKHTQLGFGHGEEMFYLPVLSTYRDDFHISYGDYHHILNNFIKPNIGFDYIDYHIVTNYLNTRQYAQCIDVCCKVLQQFNQYKVNVDANLHFKFLFNLYISSYYYLQQHTHISDNITVTKIQSIISTNSPCMAKDVVNYIFTLIKLNPNLRQVYEQNKGFYDNQFSYA